LKQPPWSRGGHWVERVFIANRLQMMANILANLGSFVLEKKEEADPDNPRRSRH